MPKMKTNRAAMKRFRVKSSGRIKRQQAYHRHLATSKSAARKRRLNSATEIAPMDMHRVRRLVMI